MSDPVTRLNAALEGRYAIERELGEGGMATVYLADDLKQERREPFAVMRVIVYATILIFSVFLNEACSQTDLSLGQDTRSGSGPVSPEGNWSHRSHSESTAISQGIS